MRPATPEAELSRDTLASSQPRLSLQGVAEVDLDQLLEPDTADLAPALSPVELRERLARQPELLEAAIQGGTVLRIQNAPAREGP